MNKKIIVASLLSAFTVGTYSNISAKNKIIATLPIAFGALFAIDKFKGSESEKSEKSDWFKMLGGTQKDIDDYKNLLKNYEATKNSLTGSAREAFIKDVEIINSDVPRTFVGPDKKYKKYNDLLGRVLKICALNDNPLKNKGYGQYGQGYNFWCGLIIKKFANNSDSISEDTEAKIYFVYKNIAKTLSLLVDENNGNFRAIDDKIYSNLRENFKNKNKLSDSRVPELIKDDDGNCIAVQSEILAVFDDFLTEDDKILLVDRLILDATADGNFNPRIALQTMADKVYEIIMENYDKFLVDDKEKISEYAKNGFDASTYRVLFFHYMMNKLGKN